jgi:hypothetical protein
MLGRHMLGKFATRLGYRWRAGLTGGAQIQP